MVSSQATKQPAAAGPGGASPRWAAAPTPPRPRVLMLLHRPPWPLDRGDRIRSYHMLRRLARRADVSVAAVSDEPITDEQRRKLYRHTEQFMIQPIATWSSRLRMGAAMLRGQALTPANFFRPDLAEQIVQWHSQARFDLVITFCTGMVGYSRYLFDAIRASGLDESPPQHMIDLVDVDSAKWDAYADASSGPKRWLYRREADRLREVEAGLFDRFDRISVVHEAEADLYRHTVGPHPGLMVLRHGVDTAAFEPMPDAGGRRLAFVGNLAYRPNVEGIGWFVREVLRPLRQQMPDVELDIVGRRPDAAVQRLAVEPGVFLHADVPDVRPHMRRAAVIIAPLQIARGAQTKVMEAMAAARAVVATPGAAAGLPVADGRELLVASHATEWVQAVSSLLNDDARRRRIAEAGARCAREKLDWSSCLAPLDTILDRLTVAPAASIIQRPISRHAA